MWKQAVVTLSINKMEMSLLYNTGFRKEQGSLVTFEFEVGPATMVKNVYCPQSALTTPRFRPDTFIFCERVCHTPDLAAQNWMFEWCLDSLNRLKKLSQFLDQTFIKCDRILEKGPLCHQNHFRVKHAISKSILRAIEWSLKHEN